MLMLFKRVIIPVRLSDCCRIFPCKPSEEGFKLLITESVVSLNPSSIFSIAYHRYWCLSPVMELLEIGDVLIKGGAVSSTRIEKVIWFSKPFDSTSIVPWFYLTML